MYSTTTIKNLWNIKENFDSFHYTQPALFKCFLKYLMCVCLQRLERQTRTMEPAQYSEFCESRQLSFGEINNPDIRKVLFVSIFSVFISASSDMLIKSEQRIIKCLYQNVFS